MFDTLSETKACDLLTKLFRARGYTIARNVMFREYGVVFHIDGWDTKARVGFEFLTSEDDDHDDLSLEEYKTLMMAQQRGELSLFVIDEVEPVSEADLIETVSTRSNSPARPAAASHEFPRRRPPRGRRRQHAVAKRKPPRKSPRPSGQLPKNQ